MLNAFPAGNLVDPGISKLYLDVHMRQEMHQ